MSEPAPSRLERLLPLTLALVGITLMVLPIFDPDAQLFYRDTGRFYYPLKKLLSDELRDGRFPLWDQWTEGGTSMLGQITPALLHPINLIYLALPVDFAFKVNSVSALYVACIGAYLVARRLGASRWGASIAGFGYGGCGYLASTMVSNLPYAYGPATVPLAVHALLRALERATPGRLAWAGAALGLCFLGADPQSMLFAGVIGSAMGAGLYGAAEGLRGVARTIGLAAIWGALGLMLAAPAILPAVVQMRETYRLGGNTQAELAAYQNHPLRLLGLAVPRAFDDTFEGYSPYAEYFADARAAFAESIVIGAPLLLFALVALPRLRGRVLLLAALIMGVLSTGTFLGVHDVLMKVPGFNFFRYAEKFVAPLSLFVALAAALGWDELQRDRRRAVPLIAGALVLAGALFAVALLVSRPSDATVRFVARQGVTRDPRFATSLLRLLSEGGMIAGASALAVALIAAWRLVASPAPLVIGALAVTVLVVGTEASTKGVFSTAPADLVHPPFPTAEKLLARAGPSVGRWRLHSESRHTPRFDFLDERVSGMAALAVNLLPRFNQLTYIEGTGKYFTAPDPVYERALRDIPAIVLSILNVRFVLVAKFDMSPAQAKGWGFEPFHMGWLRDAPHMPRSWLVARAVPLSSDEAFKALERPNADPTRVAIVRPEAAPLIGHLRQDAGPIGALPRVRVPSANRRELSVEAPRDALLVLSERYDPGWTARIDGRPAPVLRAYEVAMGVVVPPGRHEVVLQFWPRGLTAGLWALALAAVGLVAAALLRRRSPGAVAPPAAAGAA